MYDDVYNFLKTLVEKYGQEKFPVEVITSVNPEQVPVVQWLIDNDYLFAHQFYKTAYVTTSGIRAYQQETLYRKDQLQKLINEHARNETAKEIENAEMQKNSQKQMCHNWLVAIIGGTIVAAIGVAIDHLFNVKFSAHDTGFSFLKWLQSLSPP